MTGRYRHPEHRVRANPKPEEGRRRPFWLFAAIGIVLIVIISGAFSFAIISSRDKGPEIGAISISIEGRDAIISAEYTLPPGVRIRSSELELLSGEDAFPVELGGGEASVPLGVTDVAAILNEGTASITGNVKVELKYPPISMDQEVDREIDIASYLSLNNTLKPDNITVGFLGLGEVLVSLDFTAELRKEITLEARNTTAKIVTAFTSTPGMIDLLVLRSDGTGEAIVRIPSVSIVPLLLGRNLIVVDFWGFIFSFHYPISG